MFYSLFFISALAFLGAYSNIFSEGGIFVGFALIAILLFRALEIGLLFKMPNLFLLRNDRISRLFSSLGSWLVLILFATVFLLVAPSGLEALGTDTSFFVFFWLLLPFTNALADWLSLGITRHLLTKARDKDHAGWRFWG